MTFHKRMTCKLFERLWNKLSDPSENELSIMSYNMLARK